MSFLKRLFGEKKERAALRPLYDGIVAAARDPAWYRDGGVPDTLDGRFDMVAAIMALVLLRMEAEGEALRPQSAWLTEIFIEDMDATLRQIGIGDYVVGKHVGRLMGALGGRLTALRVARRPDGDFVEAARRNLYRGDPPSEEALAFAATRLQRLDAGLAAQPANALLSGRLPVL